MSAVGVFLGFRFVLALVRGFRVRGALVSLVGQGWQAGGGQLVFDAPDPGGLHVVDRAGQRPGDPQQLAGGAGDDLQVHPVAVVLAGEERPVRGDPVSPDQRPVQDREGVPGLLRGTHRLAKLRGAGGQQRDSLGHVPPGGRRAYPESGRDLRERLSFAQVDEHEQGLLPGIQLPPQGPDRGPVPADDPGDEGKGLARHRQRGTVKQHEEAPGRLKLMW